MRHKTLDIRREIGSMRNECDQIEIRLFEFNITNFSLSSEFSNKKTTETRNPVFEIATSHEGILK
jgi:hypothetical protein